MRNLYIKQTGTPTKEVQKRILTLLLSYKGFKIHEGNISIQKFLDIWFDTHPVLCIGFDDKMISGGGPAYYYNNTLYWPQDASKIIEIMDNRANIPTIKIGEYTAKVYHSSKTVEVGCQTIPFKQVDDLHKLIHQND